MVRDRPRPWPRAGAVVLMVAIGSVGFVGCSRPHGGHPGATASTTTAPQGGTRSAPTVSNPGRGPRRILRFALEAGTVRNVTVTTHLSVNQKGAGAASVVDPPAVRQTIRFRVLSADSQGARIGFRVLAAVVDPAGISLTPADALTLDSELRLLTGLSGDGHLSPDGRFTGIHLGLPASLDARVRIVARALPDQLAALTPRLPQEPVGAGASWATDDTTSVDGVAVRQQVTYVVTAIAGPIVTFRSRTIATIGRQPLTSADLPPGTTAMIESGRLTGSATGTLDLTSPVSTLDASLAGTQHVTVSHRKMAPQPVTQVVTTATTVRLAR